MKAKNDNTLQWSTRVLASTGAITLLIAAVASVWHFFASQSPSSPLHIGPLVGPIKSLATTCWISGFGAFSLAAFFSFFDLNPKYERKIALFCVVGWTILMLGFIAGAFLGTTGTQVIKAYPRTVVVLITKLAGFFSIVCGLILLAIGTFQKTVDRSSN